MPATPTSALSAVASSAPKGRRAGVAGLALALAAGVAGGIVAPAGEAGAVTVPSVCTHWASPTGSDLAAGTAAAPFASFKRLADAMGPGTVGCLTTGTYVASLTGEDVNLVKGGTSTTRATIRSAPGADVTVRGRVVVASTASDLVLAGLRLDGVTPSGRETSSVTVEADRVHLVGNDITAPTRICVSVGYGRVVSGFVAEANRIHHCGDGLPLVNGKPVRQEHGLYLEQVRGAVVRNNLIDHNYTRGIQLYYDADGSLIENNTIDSNEDGINLGAKLAGGVAYRSESNTIRNNLITNSKLWAVESYYDEVRPLTTAPGNVVSGNCVFGASSASVYNVLEGFTYTGNTWVDPQYNGQPTGDYRLKATSPCIGKGIRPQLASPLRTATAPGSVRFDARLNPSRMTATWFVRVRPCTDSTCSAVGAWVASPSANVVGVTDVAVSRTVTGLASGRTYQAQIVAHQALLPATNASALVVVSAGTFVAP